MKKTFILKPADVKRQWRMLDASEAPLGRVATIAANLLIGKDKPTYTPHVDSGEYVVIVNAAKTIVTGAKQDDKLYYRHSGYTGNLKTASFKEVIAKDPTKAIFEAVRGMLPRNKLTVDRLKRLKIYAGETHGHGGQKPMKVEVK